MQKNEVDKKVAFMHEYFANGNAATSSKFDPNSNVSSKNLVTLSSELVKGDFIKINRKLLVDRITSIYGKETADQYLNLLENHFIYKHDETSLLNYCASITMYPWLINGTLELGGSSKAPTNLQAFCGGFINLVFMVSSMLSGACATPEFLMYLNYFLGKEYGTDYYKRADETVVRSVKPKTIEKVVTDCFEQIVYSLNQPTGTRNYQSVFWNIAYYDKYYFDSLFGNFYFPDGTAADWEGTKWLQKKFMKWFNKERTKTILTFPVETSAMLYDPDTKKFKDEEWEDFSAEMYAEGHSFFTYISDSADSLSSCCFSGDTLVLWKQGKDIHYTRFEDLYNWTQGAPIEVFHNGSWVKGKAIVTDNNNFYKITTANNKVYYVTNNHIHPTYNGEKRTSELTTDDYLMFNTVPVYNDQDKENTYELGFIIGLYLEYGELHFTSTGRSNLLLQIPFSKVEHATRILTKVVGYLDRNAKVTTLKIENDIVTLQIISDSVADHLDEWVDVNKSIKKKYIQTKILTTSFKFRRGILDGWCTSQEGLAIGYITTEDYAVQIELLLTSLGIASNFTFDKEKGNGVLKWYKNSNELSEEGVYKWKNNSRYFKIVSIEKVTDKGDASYCVEIDDTTNPYFTLPSGLITHNCRLRNALTDNSFSYTLGAGGVSTGSKSVLTINVNRCVQYAVVSGLDYKEYFKEVVELCHKAQNAYNENLKEFKKLGAFPLFDAGFITMSRQYLTIGINAIVEAASFLGIEISPNEKYQKFVQEMLTIIETANKQFRTKDTMYNCEMVPAENVGVKHAKWDREDGYQVDRDCYNSYFYIVEDENTSILDKFKLHGKPYIEHLTGGSALHMNLKEHLSKEQYLKLFKIAATEGCNYFTFNIRNTSCPKCGYISKHTLQQCPKCSNENLEYVTRVIGYLKKESSFTKGRQIEAAKRVYL